ncbi:MAG: hypothetical protein NTY01_09260 [Verrucomicrobia bacterium]|nr:hypothetical protein [Verrucomicrobiota bacterium]
MSPRAKKSAAAVAGPPSSVAPQRRVSFKRRAGQDALIRGVFDHRICAFVARRQYGKTTTAADIALLKMMAILNHTVVFGSVKLDLGREITRKEEQRAAAAEQQVVTDARELRSAFGIAGRVVGGDMKLDTFDSRSGKSIAEVGDDDYVELYENSRLEFRLYHNRGSYSRTKVVALTPSTVGETGDLILDEVGRVKKFMDVWEAVEPIIASNPMFRCLFTTTPPPDDNHYSFELLAPPIGYDPAPNPAGNWYRSEMGIWVLRLTDDDAYLDGVPLYDNDTGKPISPDEARARATNKEAYDRNYKCKFVLGGTSACSLMALDSAQTRGKDTCRYFHVTDDSDFVDGLAWLAENIADDARVGCGYDPATTEKKTSNPSSFSVVERKGVDVIARAVFTWKTGDDDLHLERILLILQAIRSRPSGRRAVALYFDATNEKLFARRCQRELRGEVPVKLIVFSNTVKVPESEEPITVKQYLATRMLSVLNDNLLTLPAARYVREDWRLVRKEKGLLFWEPDSDGKHADTFCSTALGSDAAKSKGGHVEAEACGFGSKSTDGRPGNFDRPNHDDDEN